jgi:chromosome segregation ATPase
MASRITRSKGWSSILMRLVTNSLLAEAERIGRELKSSQGMLEKTRMSMEEERKVYEQTMKKLEDRLRELTITKEDAVMRVKTVQDMNTELRLTIDKLRSQEDSTRGILEEKDRYKEKEIEKLRTLLRELQREHVECQSLNQRLEREFKEYKEEKEGQFLDSQRRKDDELESYKRRCGEAEQSTKVSEY